MTAEAPPADFVEAAAIGRLVQHLKKIGPLTDEQELMVRDTWMVAFRRGARWSLETSARLSPALHELGQLLTAVCSGEIEP